MDNYKHIYIKMILAEYKNMRTENLRLSLRRFALFLGISAPTLIRILRGENVPTQKHMRAMAARLWWRNREKRELFCNSVDAAAKAERRRDNALFRMKQKPLTTTAVPPNLQEDCPST